MSELAIASSVLATGAIAAPLALSGAAFVALAWWAWRARRA